VVALVIHGVSFAAFLDYQKWGVDIVKWRSTAEDTPTACR
jgi:hypothetical protein